MRPLQPFLRLPRSIISLICFGLICYLTLVPKPLPDNDMQLWEHMDKLVHAIMFGAMYICLYLDIWRGKYIGWKRWLLMLPVAMFGGLIEILQQAMNMGRGGDIIDFAADCIGILLAAILSPMLI